MTVELYWSAAAEADLDDVWLDIAVEDVQAADKQVERIASLIFKLADFPNLGRDRSEFGTSLRGLVKDSYLILYEVQGNNRLEVKRIVHGMRDLSVLFGDGQQ
jgi:toxin ParE1/3/4